MASVSFRLLNINDPLPEEYRLATTQEAECNKEALFQAMPEWEIANLANGSVDGASYGGEVREDIRSDVSHKLAIHDPSASWHPQPSQGLTFKLFNINDQLPPQYRLATVEDVEADREALLEAMPSWEIANLANGSVDGASYGGKIRNDIRSDVSHKLAKLGGASGPLSFKLFNINDELPPQYRLATVEDVEANREALLEAMPSWEIANLADGSVDGASYGGKIRNDIRSDVSHKLAKLGGASEPLSFKLFNINDQLPPQYRLATVEDVEANREALFEAMPSWEIANLANGSVDGASYGGKIRNDIRSDVSHKLAKLGGASGDSEPLSFKLFNINDQLPPQYRLATVEDVEANREALLEAMPSWEIANLANGSVDGASYGGKIRNDIRSDVSHKLATIGGASGLLSFKLFNVDDQLPYQYRLATVEEVEDNREALLEAMPTWEIANLADGSVDGASYGGRTSTQQRDDVSHKLAVVM